jgi:nucleoside-diphosphate-sugar epimerase
MKKALVCGAGGFIGTFLVERLKKEGYWVRGVDIKNPEHSRSEADEFLILDLRDEKQAEMACSIQEGFDEIYQLAADMGGAGYIEMSKTECDIMSNSILINRNLLSAAAKTKARRYFFSSSVMVYRNMELGEKMLKEGDAYPAMPSNEYGWEKLFAERMARAFGKAHGFEVRIGRFQNGYGPRGTWTGGKEKAVAALCRKVAEAEDGGKIKVGGDGSAVRSFVYVEDLIDAIRKLMNSDIQVANIGHPDYVSVSDLAKTIIKVSGKNLEIEYDLSFPRGVQSRNFSNELISSLGWKPETSLEEGLRKTYIWIEEQVKKNKKN